MEVPLNIRMELVHKALSSNKMASLIPGKEFSEHFTCHEIKNRLKFLFWYNDSQNSTKTELIEYTRKGAENE